LSPVLPFKRLVFVVGVCLTAGTGVGLFAVPDRTADFLAWTIKAPLSAALFGAGYITAAVSLALAARERHWERARIVAVAAFSLTSLARSRRSSRASRSRSATAACGSSSRGSGWACTSRCRRSSSWLLEVRRAEAR
jgi:hypothetical protein